MKCKVGNQTQGSIFRKNKWTTDKFKTHSHIHTNGNEITLGKFSEYLAVVNTNVEKNPGGLGAYEEERSNSHSD